MSKNKSKNFYDTQKQSKPQSQINTGLDSAPDSTIDLNNYDENSQATQESEINIDENAQNQNDNQTESELAAINTQLQSSQMESKDWQNKAFRYMADFDNARKQHDLDLAQSRKNTKKNLVNPILEFLNNQYLVLSFFKSEENEQIKKSISTLQISFAKLITDLQFQGIEIIIPLVDSDFNPETMQALNSPEDNTNYQVKNIISLGLKIDNQLIQPVMVII